MRRSPEPSQILDLHLHSSRSDGRYAPDEVLERAVAGGLEVIALTDHDLIGAVEPGVHRIDGRELRVLAGAEVSGTHAGREYHLLVYFPAEPPGGFVDFCAEQIKARARRYDTAVDNIGLPDVPHAPAEARSGDRALTRLHLAQALVQAGHAQDLGDAFSRYAGHDNVPRLDLPFTECIRIARSFGGVTSWAHPPREAVNAHLETFVAAGLQGLEGLRPTLKRTDRTFFRKIARRHHLYLTGGSDWHGWHRSTPLGLFRLRGAQVTGFLDALDAAA